MAFLAILCVVLANIGRGSCESSIDFLWTPSFVSLPDNQYSHLKSSDLSAVNAALLGLAANPVESFPVTGDLFKRPKALIAIELSGLSAPLAGLSGVSYPMDKTATASWKPAVEARIAAQFAAEERTSQADLPRVKVDTNKLKAKTEPLRKELEAALGLAAGLVAAKERLQKAQAPTVFSAVVHDAGSTDNADLLYVIEQISSVAKDIFGEEGVVLQVIVLDEDKREHHLRKKREADDSLSNVQKLRKQYNVTVFISSDYPAIFAIFAGLIFILVLAVLYIAVGMWNMDPGKDSIIYRMTTTRMKKD